MICPNDGHKEWDDLDCRDCEWYYQCFKMWQDGNIWGKEQERLDNDHNAHDEPLGDSFPKFPVEHLNAQEQEVKNSINMISDYSTWEMIEAIGNAKLRIRYRMIYLKLGGRIPEKEI
jgi:hypothetical protein